MTFKHLEGDEVVVQENGVYTVHDLYTRDDGSLWAAQGNKKFFRLKADGSTSKSKGSIDTLVTERALFKDPFGRLCVTEGPTRKAVGQEQSNKLLLGS